MPEIADYISSVRNLPPAPRVVPELMRLLKQPDVDSSQIVRLISYDPSLTANVLRICNSAYFGSSVPTSDLQEAVTRLGFQQVYQLAAAATGAKLLAAAQPGYGLDQGELWKHSVAAAIAAQLMAKHVGDDPNVAFTAALLHDIGKIVLSQSLNGSYAKLVQDSDTKQLTLVDAEKKLLGTNHAEVGSELLRQWKFPPNLVAAVWSHHTPNTAGQHQKLASYVYLGNLISHFMGLGYGHAGFAMRARSEALTTLGLTSEHIPRFMMETFEQMHVIEALFAIGS